MEPDGWMIPWHRIGSTLYFGPFPTLHDAHEWAAENLPRNRSYGAIPLFLSVDWNR